MKKNIAIIIFILVVVIGGAVYIGHINKKTDGPTFVKDQNGQPTTELGIIQFSQKYHYISPANDAWPPTITSTDAAFSCTPAISEMSTTAKETINGRSYCVTRASEGAAGSTYTTYTYSTAATADTTATTTFTLRFVQCGNYDDPNKTACEKEQKEFDTGQLVDQAITDR